MKNIPLLASIVLLTLLLVGCKGTKTASNSNTPKKNKNEVNFVKSPTLTAVLEKATSEKKLVFVDFYATWCLPCRNMEEDVFTDKELAKFMNENFVNYKVDGEKGNGINLATIFEVQYYPTLLFLDANGRVLEKKVGAAYQTELREMGERAMNNGMTYVE